MSNFKTVDERVIPQAIDETSSTQLLPLGTIVRAKDIASTAYGEAEFVYALGVASTAVGSVVTISQDNYATALASSGAAKGTMIGVAMSANVASQYGFYQITGKAVMKGLTGLVDNADLYLTSTAGSVDDSGNNADRITFARSASALDTPSTGLIEAEINYPCVATSSSGIVTVSTATSMTAETHGNKTVLLTGTGSSLAQTLPAATGSGVKFRFVVGAVNTSNHVIQVTGNDVMYGNIITNSTGDTPDLAQPWPTAADSDTITLNGTTTGGAAVGDFVEVEDIATDKWAVYGVTTSSGTEATPFSAAV